MIDIIIEYGVAFGVSLFAAFLWWLLFFMIGGKKKIDYLLVIAVDCARQFEYAIKFEDYDNACKQADRLIDLIVQIENSIKLFTYFRKKKKLIRTYIYSVFYTLSVFKNVTIGYSGEQEKTQRCQRFNRKYLSQVYLDDDYSVPFISFTFELVQELNKNKFVSTALNGNWGISDAAHCVVERKQKILLEELIERKSFKEKNFDIEHFTRAAIFTYDEYERYIIKKIKRLKKAKKDK